MEMKLYTYFRSSAAFRVRIALNLKGLKPEQVFVHLRKREQEASAYAALNPQALVPTLVHDGHALGQSLAIIEYLDEIVAEPPLLPSDPQGRARARQIADVIACEMHPLCNLRVLNYLRDTLGQDERAIRSWQWHWLSLGLDAAEKLVGQGSFCYGDRPTLADICLVPQLANCRRVEMDLAAYPSLLRIERTALSLPAFELALPKNQPDAE